MALTQMQNTRYLSGIQKMPLLFTKTLITKKEKEGSVPMACNYLLAFAIQGMHDANCKGSYGDAERKRITDMPSRVV